MNKRSIFVPVLSLLLALSTGGAGAPPAVSGGAASSRAGGPGAPPPSSPSPSSPAPSLAPLLPSFGLLPNPSLAELRGLSAASGTLSACNSLLDLSILGGSLASLAPLHVWVLPPVAGTANETYLLSGTPGQLKALEDELADLGWSAVADTPEGYEEWRDDASGRVYRALSGDDWLFADSPAALTAALAALPSLPPTLPVEGDAAVLWRLDGLPASHELAPLAPCFESIAAGVGLDGDTAAFQTRLVPRPGSPLAARLREIPPIGPEAACVNLPDALAFLAVAPVPEIVRIVAGHELRPLTRAQTLAAVLLPPDPAADDAFDSILAFAATPDSAAALDAFAHRVRPLRDASAHRGIPILAPDPDAERPRLTVADPGYAFWYLLRDAGASLRLAALPSGVLAACNVPPGTLENAIDAALDGGLSTRQFDQSPAFRAAFPYPDAPPVAILHADLAALADACPPMSFAAAVPSAASLDAFAYVDADGALVLRCRSPLALFDDP